MFYYDSDTLIISDLADLLSFFFFYRKASAVVAFSEPETMGDSLLCMVLRESLCNIKTGGASGNHVLSYLLITVDRAPPDPDLPMLG